MARDWRTYQQEIADFFRSLGLAATVDAQVDGVRARHTIDVRVTFERFGIQHRWVVERKHWRSRIP